MPPLPQVASANNCVMDKPTKSPVMPVSYSTNEKIRNVAKMYAAMSTVILNASLVDDSMKQQAVWKSWCLLNSSIKATSAPNTRIVGRPCKVDAICVNTGGCATPSRRLKLFVDLMKMFRDISTIGIKNKNGTVHTGLTIIATTIAPNATRMCWIVSSVNRARNPSMAPKSLENRFCIRPDGFVLKNRIEVATTPRNIPSCRFCEAAMHSLKNMNGLKDKQQIRIKVPIMLCLLTL